MRVGRANSIYLKELEHNRELKYNKGVGIRIPNIDISERAQLRKKLGYNPRARTQLRELIYNKGVGV
jgi:endonuclease YncB( thermonuclease family)